MIINVILILILQNYLNLINVTVLSLIIVNVSSISAISVNVSAIRLNVI